MYTYKVGTRSVYLTIGDYNASLPDFEIAIYKLPAGTRLTLEHARKIAVEFTDWRQRRARRRKQNLFAKDKPKSTI